VAFEKLQDYLKRKQGELDRCKQDIESVSRDKRETENVDLPCPATSSCFLYD